MLYVEKPQELGPPLTFKLPLGLFKPQGVTRMSFSQNLFVRFQYNFMTLSVFHISSMCQKIQEIDKLFIILL